MADLRPHASWRFYKNARCATALVTLRVGLSAGAIAHASYRFVIGLAIVVLGTQNSGAEFQDLVSARLEPGQAIRGTLVEGELRVFALTVEMPGIWRLVGEQRGIDFRLLIRDPAGTEIGEIGNPLDRKGTVRWTGRLEMPGTYEIELRTLSDTAPSGEFRLQAADLTQAESLLLEAEEAMTRAATLQLDDSKDAERRAAVEDYSNALERWRRIGDEALVMETLYAMARLSQRLDDRLHESIGFLEEVAALAARLQDDDFEASSQADLGLGYRQLGELAKAEKHLKLSVALYESLKDPFGGGTALNTLCMIEHSRGHLREVLDCYKKALAMIRQTGSVSHEAAILHNLGYAFDCLGEPEAAIQTYGQALAARRQAGDRAGEVDTLNNLASALFRGEGSAETALSHYDTARKLLSELGDRRRLATIINNQGYAYRRLGKPERALVLLQEALELHRAVGNMRSESVTLNGLGLIYRELGELSRAREAHEKALVLAQRVERRRGIGLSLAYLGRVLVEAGEGAQGVRRLDDAVENLRQAQDLFYTALAWHHRAVGLLAMGDLLGADTSLRQALELRRKVADRTGEAESLSVLAATTFRRGDLEGALAQARDALRLVEETRARILGPEIRMAFLANRATTYELVIDLLMEKHLRQPGAGFEQEALEVSERSRSRTLFELLHEPRVGRVAGVDSSLIQRRESLLMRLNAKASRLTKLRRVSQHETAGALSLEAELEAVLAELELVERDIRHATGHDPGRVPYFRVSEIQGALGSGTALLEYSLGHKRSFLWLVTSEGVEAHVLPPRETLTEAARGLHRAWSTLDRRGGRRDAELAKALSRQILGPIWGLLEGRRVAVVADGALHSIPFAALPVPDGEHGWSPLVKHSEVTHVPSMSVLIRQRQRAQKRPLAEGVLAVFADPVFSAADPRVRTARVATAADPEASAAPAVREAGLETLNRLPSTREEAERISLLAPGGQVWIALDQEASRPMAVSGRLGQYRHVHFATHGLASEERPELSGLALSMVTAEGKSVDGFLRLRDIYDLNLSAELVVLSGCRTALGKSVRGEGPVGLVRGFLSAGAERVVASLWWVKDRATAELMESFYRGLWLEGLGPSAALRQAQLQLLAQRQSEDPFYWAAFVHQGDWQPQDNSPGTMMNIERNDR